MIHTTRVNSLFESFDGVSTPAARLADKVTVNARPTPDPQGTVNERAELLSKHSLRDFWRIMVDVKMSENGGKNPMATVVEAPDKEGAIDFVKAHFFQIEPQLVKYMRIPATPAAVQVGDVTHIATVDISKLPTIAPKLLKEANEAAAKGAERLQRSVNKERRSHPETALQVVLVRTDESGDYDVVTEYIWQAPDFVQRGYLLYGETSKREPLYLFD